MVSNKVTEQAQTSRVSSVWHGHVHIIKQNNISNMSSKHKQIFREQYELNRNKPNDQTTDDSLPVLLVAILNNKMTNVRSEIQTINKIQYDSIHNTIK